MTINKNLFFSLALASVLIAVSGYFLHTKIFSFTELDIPGVRYFDRGVELAAFNLTDHNGVSFGKADLSGQWSVLFFGYTHCPDICPTAMLNMKNIYNELQHQDEIDSIQVVFVSVDPQRDDQAILKDYMNYFHADFKGVTGVQNEINLLANRVGAIYDFEDSVSGDPITDINRLNEYPGYLVNHYSSFIVFNPDGQMVAHIYPPHDTQRVVSIFNSIMNS